MEAFERQLVLLAPRLRRHARGLTGDTTLADDLVQDTLERALRYRWRFRLRPGAFWGDGADGLLPWLLTLMHRLRLNTLRRADLVTTTDTLPDVAAPGADPGLRRDLLDALARLPEAQRAVLLLVSLEQFSYAEAAQVLEVPIGTVMSRLARAREHMRRLLDGGKTDAAPPTTLQRVK
ncbi:MAG: RNA polymerase sigma factor [Cupriavidus sp.]|jgi:RNA polymerase sigma-70 factor (ECF subfamily)|uniref:RNA polymerase sigma factor n=1 Tax=Cupriavidus pauculus TaxID=82633 RepID=UPI000786795F|nr:RNA polymerase sigma factor [Cupriavidus pauculus]MBU70294.1 RNA polymerase sigma factor [Cupriavidus sp.]KAB0602329.1 RNA polymerase sigma factor [Cupriavidus pauculus]MBY4733581.1 RNA polymerase sigma factor [Cupriavidus pauculus]MCM3608655.1 RNA polymerase sigma factor [Cupriavidus pauculus]UAL01007.1 RNA polymerase sigma factor [Cupriavidus pauculus]